MRVRGYAEREDLIEIGKVAYVRSIARVREVTEGKVDRGVVSDEERCEDEGEEGMIMMMG